MLSNVMGIRDDMPFTGIYKLKVDRNGLVKLPKNYAKSIIRRNNRDLTIFLESSEIEEGPCLNCYDRYCIDNLVQVNRPGLLQTEMNMQGKISIPEPLIARAKLGEIMYVKGTGEYFHILNQMVYSKYWESISDKFKSIPASLANALHISK